MNTVYLAHIDGKLPNLALMKIAAWARKRGNQVRLIRPRDRFPGALFDRGPVYASSIFTFSQAARAAFVRTWGKHVEIIWGGTGLKGQLVRTRTFKELDGSEDWEALAPDYSIYPWFKPSLGFTQRGCRLECEFCEVPAKEGKVKSVASLASIWRGPGHARDVILLDNDFFGQEEDRWRAVIDEARARDLHLCFMQGINVRAIKTKEAAALASVEYRNTRFNCRRLYTAWDNLDDESVFKKGIARLVRAGIPTEQIMVYMLCGFAEGETWAALWHRFAEMVSLGVLPYPMPFDKVARPDLRAFQRWVVTGLYRAVPWPDYRPGADLEALITPAMRDESYAAWKRVIGHASLKGAA